MMSLFFCQLNAITWLGHLGASQSHWVYETTTLAKPLCDPMDYTVHGILQARVLEWVAFPFSRGSFQTRNRTQISHIAGRFFTSWATREAQEAWSGYLIPSPADLQDPGIEPGSPALQVDSLPTELSGKPIAISAYRKEPLNHFSKVLTSLTHYSRPWWRQFYLKPRGGHHDWSHTCLIHSSPSIFGRCRLH